MTMSPAARAGSEAIDPKASAATPASSSRFMGLSCLFDQGISLKFQGSFPAP
jgi:hypothetical protein